MSVGSIVASFLIPVICGYVLINIHPAFKLHVLAHNENGYRLIMRSLIYGLIYLFSTIWLYDFISFVWLYCSDGSGCKPDLKGIENINPILTTAKIFDAEKLHSKYVFAALGLLFGSYALQRTFRAKEVQEQETNIEEKYLADNGDHFISKAIDAQKNGKYVIVSTRSRKVYTGFISERPKVLSNVGRKSLVLWPITSGYRDENTLEVRKTNSYWFFFEVLQRKNSIEKHFAKTPNKSFSFKAQIDDNSYKVEFDKSDFDELMENFGVTIEWEDVESIISYIPSVESTSITNLDKPLQVS